MSRPRSLGQESLTVTSIVCPHCEAVLDATDELCSRCGKGTTTPRSSAAPRRRFVDRPWVIVVVMLHLGLLGIPIYWNTNYSVRARLMFVSLSIIYTVFAVLVIVWALMKIAEAVQLMSG